MLTSQAIRQVTPNCWTLVDADGQPVDVDENIPHYNSEDDARKAIERWNPHTYQPRQMTPVEEDGPCFIIAARCGYILDQEGEGIQHAPTVDDLFQMAVDIGWKAMPDGTMLCGPEACDDCKDTLPPAGEPDRAPTPGQIALVGPDVAVGADVPAKGQFCKRHFSWLCQAGQGACQRGENASTPRESTRDE